MARYLAKAIVSQGRATKAEVQLSYAIGVQQPVSVHIDTFGTQKKAIAEIHDWITNTFDLSPQGIITFLNLKNPIYKKTATYGHFGRDDVAWEHIKTIAQ